MYQDIHHQVQFSHLVIARNLSLNISSLDNYGKTGRNTSKSGSVKPSNFSTYGPAFYFKAFFYWAPGSLWIYYVSILHFCMVRISKEVHSWPGRQLGCAFPNKGPAPQMLSIVDTLHFPPTSQMITHRFSPIKYFRGDTKPQPHRKNSRVNLGPGSEIQEEKK